jgi:hypothetical protein
MEFSDGMVQGEPIRDSVLTRSENPAVSRGMAGIKIWRRFLPTLRHHFCRIGLSGHPSGAKLLPLNIVLGSAGFAVVNLSANLDALIINLPTGFRTSVAAFVCSRYHFRISLVRCCEIASCKKSNSARCRYVLASRPRMATPTIPQRRPEPAAKPSKSYSW